MSNTRRTFGGDRAVILYPYGLSTGATSGLYRIAETEIGVPAVTVELTLAWQYLFEPL